MTSLLVAVSLYGVVLPIVAYVVLIVTTARRAPKSRMIGAAVFGLLATGALGAICAALWFHPRPELGEFIATPANAFPSWPVAGAAMFAMLLFWRNRAWGMGGIVVTLAIAAARLVARVETFADALGGLLVGAVGGFVGLTLFTVLWHRLYLAVRATMDAEKSLPESPRATADTPADMAEGDLAAAGSLDSDDSGAFTISGRAMLSEPLPRVPAAVSGSRPDAERRLDSNTNTANDQGGGSETAPPSRPA